MGMARRGKSKGCSRVRSEAFRRLLAVLLALLALVMISTAFSEDSANSDNSTPYVLGQALSRGRPTLAGFVGDDCCQTITPTLEEPAVDYDGTFNILIIEAGEQKDLVSQYGITLTPTQVYFDTTGAEVERIVDRSTKEEMVNRLVGIGA